MDHRICVYCKHRWPVEEIQQDTGCYCLKYLNIVTGAVGDCFVLRGLRPGNPGFPECGREGIGWEEIESPQTVA